MYFLQKINLVILRLYEPFLLDGGDQLMRDHENADGTFAIFFISQIEALREDVKAKQMVSDYLDLYCPLDEGSLTEEAIYANKFAYSSDLDYDSEKDLEELQEPQVVLDRWHKGIKKAKKHAKRSIYASDEIDSMRAQRREAKDQAQRYRVQPPPQVNSDSSEEEDEGPSTCNLALRQQRDAWQIKNGQDVIVDGVNCGPYVSANTEIVQSIPPTPGKKYVQKKPKTEKKEKKPSEEKKEKKPRKEKTPDVVIRRMEEDLNCKITPQSLNTTCKKIIADNKVYKVLPFKIASRPKCPFCNKTTEKIIDVQPTENDNNVIVSACNTCTLKLTYDQTQREPKFNHAAIWDRLVRSCERPIAFNNDGSFIEDFDLSNMCRSSYLREATVDEDNAVLHYKKYVETTPKRKLLNEEGNSSSLKKRRLEF